MTPEQILEAQRLAVAFQIALARLGAAAIVEAIRLFARLNPASLSANSVREWLEDATAMIDSRRSVARDLGIAYFRLQRALETGYTTPPIRGEVPEVVDLDELREDFREIAERAGVPEIAPDDPNFERIDWGFLGSGGSVQVEDVIDLDEFERHLDELDEDAIEQAVDNLLNLGVRNLEKKVQQIVGDDGMASVSDIREAQRDAALRQAASADRLVKNAGRGPVFHLIDNDRRAIGYVRMSTTGTPCGWCAMLISRGFVYKSEASATYADGDKYHDNCKCVAVPVYSADQYFQADVFAQNREYHALWPKVTAGYSQKEAVAVWRKFIRLVRSGMDTDEAIEEANRNGVRVYNRRNAAA